MQLQVLLISGAAAQTLESSELMSFSNIPWVGFSPKTEPSWADAVLTISLNVKVTGEDDDGDVITMITLNTMKIIILWGWLYWWKV